MTLSSPFANPAYLLADKIDKTFAMPALRRLARAGDNDPENLNQISKSDFAYDVVQQFVSKGMLDSLQASLVEEHPNIDWAELIAPLRSVPPSLPTDDDASGDGTVAPTVRPKGDKSPYMGLNFFDKDDRDLFFGRQRLINQLMGRLSDPFVGADEAVDEDGKQRVNFLPIIGASGSGKSSLVRAGLIPIFDAQEREVCVIRPGRDPLRSLKAVAQTVAQRNTFDDMLAAGKTNALDLLLFDYHNAKTPFVLVVDQFEELFTTLPPRDTEAWRVARAERKLFIANLMSAVEAARGGMTTVIVTLRADFLSQCADYPQLWRAINTNKPELVLAMQRSELVQVIREPARKLDYTITDELVNTILRDCGVMRAEDMSENGVLPLLSHALDQMWEQSAGRVLTHSAYVAAGRVQGAIAQTAEAVFTKLDEGEQAAARYIFLQLTELGEGREDTRRRVPLADLRARLAAPDASNRDLLNYLADRRLITIDETDVEVTHEVLIRQWSRLRGWLDDNRAALRLQRKIGADAAAWRAHECTPDFLYRGLRLERAVAWLTENGAEASGAERTFIEAGAAAHERQIVEQAQIAREIEEARCRREVAMERSRAEAQARLSQTLRRVAYGMSALALVAVLVSIFAVQQSNAAKARTLLVQAQDAMAQEKNTLAALLALESQRLEQSAGATVLLGQLPYDGLTPHDVLNGHNEGVLSVAWDPISGRVASGAKDGTVKVWELDREGGVWQQVATLDGHRGWVWSVAWDPISGRVTSVGSDGMVKVWDVESQEVVASLDGHSGESVNSVAWDPISGRVASGADDGTVKVWDVESGEEVATLDGHSGWVLSVAWDPISGRVASGGSDGAVKVWDVESGEEVASLDAHSGWVYSVAWDPISGRVASGADDGIVKVWDVESGEEVATLDGHSGWVYSVAWDPISGRVASAADDGMVKVWDVERGEAVALLDGHADWVRSVAWDPISGRVASGSEDGMVKVWDLESREEAALLDGHTDWVRSVAWDPISGRVASGADDGMIKVWDVESGEEVASLDGHSGWVYSVAWDPISGRVASGAYDGTVKVWDVESGEEVASLDGRSGWVYSVAWDPISGRVASGAKDGAVKVWDVESGEEVVSLDGHSESVMSVAWDPISGRLASGAEDKTVKVWDVGSGEEVMSLDGHSESVMSVAWDPISGRLASGSYDGTVKVWDVERGAEVVSLDGHSGIVSSVAWDPISGRVASGASDTLVKVWDVESGEEVTSLGGRFGWVTSVAWDPINERLASGASDRRIKILPVKLMDSTCNLISRNLTADEWKLYGNGAIYHKGCDNWSAPNFNDWRSYPSSTWRNRFLWGGRELFTVPVFAALVFVVLVTRWLWRRVQGPIGPR